MKTPLTLRAKQLRDHARGQLATVDGEQALLGAFRETPADRSLLWFVANLKRVLLLALLAGVGALVLLLPLSRVEPWRDVRLTEDYRDHPPADWAFLDDHRVVLATHGGGVQYCRLDGGKLGFWKTYDRRNTGGALPEANLVQAHFDGDRLWFVGERGSLASCDRHMGDWNLPFGGVGFVQNVDLAEELLCLGVGMENTVFAIGTRRHGLGIYDIRTRQWQRLSDADLRDERVSAVVFHEDRLWVGTPKGLNVFRVRREGEHLEVEHRPQGELPRPFTDRPVRALHITADGSVWRVHCLVGRGAHLETIGAGDEWRVVASEGDERLATLQGAAVVPGLVPTPEGVCLVLPERGFAFYRGAKRELTLRNDGLRTRPDGLCSPRLVLRTDVGGRPHLWAVAGDHASSQDSIYHWSGQSWQDMGAKKERVVELEPTDGRLVARTADGCLRWYAVGEAAPSLLGALAGRWPWSLGAAIPGLLILALAVARVIRRRPPDKARRHARIWLAVAGAGALLAVVGAVLGALCRVEEGAVRMASVPTLAAEELFFEANPCPAPFGPAEVGQSQFFVSSRDSGPAHQIAARYLKDRRGWQAMRCNNEVPFLQLRAGDNALWGAKRNGEAGIFAPLDAVEAPTYRPLFGPSDLPTGPKGRVISAALSGRLWLIYEDGQGERRPYCYDGTGRLIAAAGNGLPAGFRAEQLRAAGETLYLWGKETGRGSVRTANAGSSGKPLSWEAVTGEKCDVVQMVVSPKEVACRSSTGEVYLRDGSGQQTTLFEGRGARQWKSLHADRFGRLWGLGQSGEVSTYDRRTGSWKTASLPKDHKATALLIVQGDGVDRIFVGTDQSLQVFEVGEGQVKEPQGDGPFGGIRRLDHDGKRLWALTLTGDVWRRNGGSDKWEKLWEAGPGSHAPAPEDWIGIWWADFAEQELWFATPRELWRYNLRTSTWNSLTLRGRDHAKARWAPGSPRCLWYLDGQGTLRFVDADKKRDSTRGQDEQQIEFDGCPDYHSWLEPAAFCCSAISLTGAALAVLFLLWVLLRLLFESLFRRDREANGRPLRRLVGFLVVCAAAGGCELLNRSILQPGIDAYRPFLGKHFKGEVQDFAVNGAELRVRSKGGVWTFVCDGGKVSRPKAFRSGEQSPLEAPVPREPSTDESGVWQLKPAEKGYLLARKDANGNYIPCHPVKGGLAEDHFQDIAAADGDTLVAVTSAGVAEYKATESLKFVRFVPDLQGTLARHEGAVYCVGADGIVRRYTTPPAATWPVSASPWPRAQQSAGVRWRTTPGAVELDDDVYDVDKGQFRSDVCLRTIKDRKGVIWFQTRAGWRECQFTDKGATLAEPVAGPPEPAPAESRFQAARRWKCLRVEGENVPDEITFTCSEEGHPPTNNPFGVRGRWPDEDVRAVFPIETGVLFGTGLGLIVREKSGRETLELAGHLVTRIDRAGGRLLCRTSDGDYEHRDAQWRRVEQAPPGAFSDERTLRLPLGEGVAVEAVERAGADGPATELRLYDGQERRFRHDIVRSMSGDGGDLWLLTADGLQRLWFGGSKLQRQRAELPGRHPSAIRRGTAGVLYARVEKATFRAVEGGWQDVPPGDRLNPFEFPLEEAVTELIYWQRCFDPAGDQFQLRTRLGVLSFHEGKLDLDFALAAAGTGETRLQATPAGLRLLRSTSTAEALLPWPEPRDDRRAPEVRLVEGRAACRPGGGKAFLFDDTGQRWEEGSAVSFRKPVVQFDGLRWNVLTTEDAGAPALSAVDPVEGKLSGTAVRLNRYGQFPFDAVHHVTSRSGKLWVAHDMGVSVYSSQEPPRGSLRWLRGPSTDGKARLLLKLAEDGRVWLAAADLGGGATRFYGHSGSLEDPSGLAVVPEGVAANPFLRPLEWSGEWGGKQLTLRGTEDPARLEIQRKGEEARPLAVGERVLDIHLTSSALWLLTEHRLIRVKP